MEQEVHIYSGSGCITEKSISSYPVGQRHAFLFYLKENKNSELNWEKAEDKIMDAGINDIEFSRAGKVAPEKITTDEKREIYNNTLKSGSSLILYCDPV
jgi:hypothetical protein